MGPKRVLNLKFINHLACHIRGISWTSYICMNKIKRDMTPLIANGKIYTLMLVDSPHSRESLPLSSESKKEN